MRTKITVGIDNIAANGLKGEWGLSLMIEYGDKKILLDAGASALFLKNYEKLGFDIADVDYGVLSHAHCDHANGIPAFFEHNKKAKFYVSENTAPDCYGKILFVRFYTGIPKTMMTDYADRIVKVSGVYEITDGVYIVPHRAGGYPEPENKAHMLRQTAGGFKSDGFCHEQSLVVDSDKGLLIFNSCSHSGPEAIIGGTANTFEDIREHFHASANYIGLGPFRFTTTKEKLSPVLGIDGYRRIMQQVREAGIDIPVVAIGGITSADVSALMQTGIAGIALSGAILRADNPAEEINRLRAIIQ